LRFNFIDYESKTSTLDFLENLVNLLTDVSSITKRSNEGGNQAFWRDERKKLIRNSINLLLLAERPIEIRSLYNLIATSPRTAEQLKSSDWRASSYLYSLLAAANKLNAAHEEFALVENYFLVERLELHGGTRGTIEAEFTGTFDSLRRGKIGQLFGTTTNITPADILAGRIVVIDVPTDTWREIGSWPTLSGFRYFNVLWIGGFIRHLTVGRYFFGVTRAKNSALNRMPTFSLARGQRELRLCASHKDYRRISTASEAMVVIRLTRCLDRIPRSFSIAMIAR
jgi:hypothetical protein